MWQNRFRDHGKAINTFNASYTCHKNIMKLRNFIVVNYRFYRNLLSPFSQYQTAHEQTTRS
uniref:Uncharacterized protein n=1 Tax=Octopus bimaculoides TaxID=37653 RepID=A0A0L8FT84_OCTBM